MLSLAAVIGCAATATGQTVHKPLANEGGPAAPPVIVRDESGQVTVRAVRTSTPLRIDGRLDEPHYTVVQPFGDFIQVEPQAGAPATERIDIWVSFDADNVYVSFRCWESRPDRIIAKEMRRDHPAIFRASDHVAFMFDTFHDRRNSFLFEVNAAGGRYDGQVVNERESNPNWNGVWDWKAGRFDGGWTLEAAIPFKTLRYRSGRTQVWGFNVRRGNEWKNESSFLTPMPASLGDRGIFQASLAATLVGIEAPAPSSRLEIKPYAVSDVVTDRAADIAHDVRGDVGVDVKYGVTQSLTADFTYNTDFAQVEADEQQVNLTRFSLFFPEKREFFLENAGTFTFGSATGASGDTPVLFYSRRIGLNAGRAVPIEGGGRLTGRVGRFTIGALNIQSGREPHSGARAANFSVVRIKRDILRRSAVGFLSTRRSISQVGPGANATYGVDGTFAFYDNLAINTYWATTRTNGLDGNDVSYRAELDYSGDAYGLRIEHLFVGDRFNPEVGFLRRSDIRKSAASARFSPRPRNDTTVRKFSWTGSGSYIENGSGRVETREVSGQFSTEFQTSDILSADLVSTYEFLPYPFAIVPGIVLPVGGYDSVSGRVGFAFGPQRPVSGAVAFEYGSFYNGTKATVRVSQGRVDATAQLSIEPTYQMDTVELEEGSFRSHLLASRVTYTMTPLMFVSALLQYNTGSHSMSSNVRLRWEYQPGSELFVVYNEERDTLGGAFPDLANRAFIVKINRLLQF